MTKFDDNKEFFEKVGDSFLHPTRYGDSYYSVSIEEMYQRFKARMMQEISTDREGIIGLGVVVDPTIPEDEIVFRDEEGREVGRITNIAYKA